MCFKCESAIKTDLHPREHWKCESKESLLHFSLSIHPPHPHKHTTHRSWLSFKRPLSMLCRCYCPCFDTRGRKLHCNRLKTGDLRLSTNTHTYTRTHIATYLAHYVQFLTQHKCAHTSIHTQRQAECDTMRGKLNHSVEIGGDSGISWDFFWLFLQALLVENSTNQNI